MNEMPRLGRHRYEVAFVYNDGTEMVKVNVFTEEEVSSDELKRLGAEKAKDLLDYLQMPQPDDLTPYSYDKK